MSTNQLQVAADGDAVCRTRRRLLRGALAAGACVLLAAVCLPADASAHGGTRVVSRIAGGFRVAVDALAIRSGDRVGAVDYTVTLQRPQGGTPVTDAHVKLSVETPGGTIGPLVVHRRLNTYGAVIPVSGGPGWESYQVAITISSPGTRPIVIAYHPPAAAFTWPWRQPLVLGGACLACVLYARGFARLRRRGRRDLASAAASRCSDQESPSRFWQSSPRSTRSASATCSLPTCFSTWRSGTPPRPSWSPAYADRSGSSCYREPCCDLRPHCGHPALGECPAQPGCRPRALGGRLRRLARAGGLRRRARESRAPRSGARQLLRGGACRVDGLLEPFPRRRLPIRSRMGIAVVLLVLGNALSDTLLLSPHPLYAAYADQPVRLWGLSALADQRLAGAVMMVEQLASLTLCMAFLVRCHRRTPTGRQARHVGVMT